MKIHFYNHLRGILFGFQIYNHEPTEFEGEKIEGRLSVQIYIGFVIIIISTKNFNYGTLWDDL